MAAILSRPQYVNVVLRHWIVVTMLTSVPNLLSEWSKQKKIVHE